MAGAKPRSWWHQLQDAMEGSNLPPSDRAVFAFDLRKADYGSAELPAHFTPKQEDAARATGFTLRQVRRCERHLERHGWLKVSGATGPGKRRTIMLALGSDCDCTGRVHEVARVRRTEDTSDPRSADTNGGHAAGQRPVPAGWRGRQGKEPKSQDQQLRAGDRVSCPFCGADGVVGERLIEHKPGCWRGGMLALYGQEPGS